MYSFNFFAEAMSDLVICRLSDAAASVAGGREIILLCEKVTKGKRVILKVKSTKYYNF